MPFLMANNNECSVLHQYNIQTTPFLGAEGWLKGQPIRPGQGLGLGTRITLEEVRSMNDQRQNQEKVLRNKISQYIQKPGMKPKDDAQTYGQG